LSLNHSVYMYAVSLSAYLKPGAGLKVARP
jgi:hypothetical protein